MEENGPNRIFLQTAPKGNFEPILLKNSRLFLWWFAFEFV